MSFLFLSTNASYLIAIYIVCVNQILATYFFFFLLFFLIHNDLVFLVTSLFFNGWIIAFAFIIYNFFCSYSFDLYVFTRFNFVPIIYLHRPCYTHGNGFFFFFLFFSPSPLVQKGRNECQNEQRLTNIKLVLLTYWPLIIVGKINK